jgi:hypothetical protein
MLYIISAVAVFCAGYSGEADWTAASFGRRGRKCIALTLGLLRGHDAGPSTNGRKRP